MVKRVWFFVSAFGMPGFAGAERMGQQQLSFPSTWRKTARHV